MASSSCSDPSGNLVIEERDNTTATDNLVVVGGSCSWRKAQSCSFNPTIDLLVEVRTKSHHRFVGSGCCCGGGGGGWSLCSLLSVNNSNVSGQILHPFGTGCKCSFSFFILSFDSSNGFPTVWNASFVGGGSGNFGWMVVSSSCGTRRRRRP